jgi:hypothetical protein
MNDLTTMTHFVANVQTVGRRQFLFGMNTQTSSQIVANSIFNGENGPAGQTPRIMAHSGLQVINIILII